MKALDEFRSAIGEKYVLTRDADRARFETDWRGLERDPAAAVLRPGDTQEVAACVKICATHGLFIVPQTGNTGLSFASTPTPDLDRQVVISLERMNRVLAVDAINNSMEVEAGCVLQTVQETADAHDRFFALDLNARGSCRIGGNISTNAGGINVLAYGNCRDQVLGLEVVLPDGTIWDGRRALRKDNSGYDLKHLFIGAEGTLGIVTRATLKLHPKPRAHLTLLAATPSPDTALELLAAFKALPTLTSFELLMGTCVVGGARLVEGIVNPLAEDYGWYILSEHSLFDADTTAAEARLLDILGSCMERGLILDATVAQSETQAKALWDIREGTTPLQSALGPSIKHDVAVPVSSVPTLIARTMPALETALPSCRPLPFGHLGDGNLHFNVIAPEGMGETEFKQYSALINQIVHDEVLKLEGTISAEHGIGRLRKDELARTKDPVALALMRSVKQTLDPEGRMNPGKLL